VEAAFASPSSLTWQTKAAMPTSRGDLAAVADDTESFIFVAGGWNDRDDGAGALGGFLSTVEVYDVSRNSWFALPSMPEAAGDGVLVFYQSSLLYAGGEVWSGTTSACPWDASLLCDVNEVPLSDVFALHLENAQELLSSSSRRGDLIWGQRASLPESRFRLAGAVYGDALFIFGGHDIAEDTQTDAWAFHDAAPLPIYAHVPK
jgi:hypothetical protein